jgi:DtxR family Mn-dependent transcriptional regulator
MSWAEVHDEAERLEHAVSERLIERIDDMLGRPMVDPHGDPIPTPEGTMPASPSLDLLSAPVAAPLVVSRIVDQDPAFLRFLDTVPLTPGAAVIVEARDQPSDTVLIRLASGVKTTIGARAASKVLVETAGPTGPSEAVR